jgi:hypothetical protein
MDSIRQSWPLSQVTSGRVPETAAPRATPQVTPQVAPTVAQDAKRAPLLASRQQAAVAPRPEYPNYATADAYPSMRRAEATAVLAWPTACDLDGPFGRAAAFEHQPSGPQDKPTVMRLWVHGQSPPLDPPTAAEHAWQFLKWLQGQSPAAGHLVTASDLKRLYPHFCVYLALWPLPWQSVAKHLARLIGGTRSKRINGENVRVYFVPRPAAAEPVAHRALGRLDGGYVMPAKTTERDCLDKSVV